MKPHANMHSPVLRSRGRVSRDHSASRDTVGLIHPSQTLAPFTSLPRLILQLAHVVLVLALVSIAAWFAWTHILQPSLTGRETVITVVDPIVVVRSPESGVFRREGGLIHGSRVAQGQLLGVILAPAVENEQHLLLAESTALSRTLLARDTRAANTEPNVRDLEIRLAAVEAQLMNVQRRIADLEVRSPVEGTIQFGVGDYQEVDGDRTAIAQLWPIDAVTLIEIEAPLHVVTDLIQRGIVRCEISTPEGRVGVAATPIAETLQTFFREELEGRRKSQWASLRCCPDELPESANRPGLVGAIQY